MCSIAGSLLGSINLLFEIHSGGSRNLLSGGVSTLEGGHIHCIGGGRMLQLGVPKNYGGSSRCAKNSREV